MNKTRVKMLVSMMVLTVSLLIIGAFCDLSLSERICDGEHSILGLLGGMAGKLPAYLMLAFAFGVLMNYVMVNGAYYKKGIRILLMIVYAGAILVSLLLAFYSAFEEVTSKAKYLAIGLTLVVGIVMIYLLIKKTLPRLEELKKWALLTILAIGIIILATVFLKSVWGRERYLSIANDGAKFTPWYIPQGITGGHSFPSGHTALWGALYMFIPLLGVLRLKGEGLLTLGIVASQLLIGAFRIVGGHHFLSDVTMSILISFVVCILVTIIGYKEDFSDSVLSEKNILRKI